PKKELPGSIALPERPRMNHMPYRGSVTGSMYYLGVPSELKDAGTSKHFRGPEEIIEEADELSTAEAVSRKKTRQFRRPMEMFMACDNEPKDAAFSSRARQSRPLDFAPQHIRFQPNIPTRASQLAVDTHPTPIDNSVFAVSSPGDVSPISTASSPTKLGSIDSSGQSARVKDIDRSAGKTFPVLSASGQPTSQGSKPGRPSLTLTIPDSARKRPVEVTRPSPGSDIDGVQASAETTPIHTPAHARRLPARTGSRAAKNPNVTLADELALFSLPSTGLSAPPVSLSASETHEPGFVPH
ncbi:MAG: hypothetical protein Q9224_003626, partial [Gallowayella concinna]